MSDDSKMAGIEKFDSKDFNYWKMQIEDYLYGKKLHQPLSGDKPPSLTEDDWKLLDRQVPGVIRLTISRSVAQNVSKETTTVGLMKVLSSMYETPSANNKVYLMKKLFNLRMTEGGEVTHHLNEFNALINNLSYVEIKFEDEVMALILLASLPNSWEPMRMAVSNSVGKSKLAFDNVRDLIFAEEVRVFLANGEELAIVGIGEVRLALPNKSIWLLEKVRHIPGLRRNLISVGQLDDEGHAILFNK
ncbi:uncharacterized protein LOC119995516 [Tripterygium wilfordii]|uniref:uncharacterized protein LOC119995516 n=1 Tax=Tripterygium wilfordii TaxID=458696 RepID=UPI0018F80DC0|nr:uncharacterized protein LOC119995516 [Tripterygium wilfordii]